MSEERSRMTFLPVCLRIEGRRVLVVGAGKAAWHKLKGLLPFTREITVLSPEFSAEVSAAGLRNLRKEYQTSDLAGFGLIYACTSSREVNARIADDAAAAGILCNACDDPGSSAFISPAVFTRDRMSVAVSSDATDVRRSIRWRDRISEVILHDKI